MSAGSLSSVGRLSPMLRAKDVVGDALLAYTAWRSVLALGRGPRTRRHWHEPQQRRTGWHSAVSRANVLSWLCNCVSSVVEWPTFLRQPDWDHDGEGLAPNQPADQPARAMPAPPAKHQTPASASLILSFRRAHPPWGVICRSCAGLKCHPASAIHSAPWWSLFSDPWRALSWAKWAQWVPCHPRGAALRRATTQIAKSVCVYTHVLSLQFRSSFVQFCLFRSDLHVPFFASIMLPSR